MVLTLLMYCCLMWADVPVEQVFIAGRSVRVRARTCSPAAACPGCGAVSARVHSSYERRLLDTAAGGQEVLICLSARRFFCLVPACPKGHVRRAGQRADQPSRPPDARADQRAAGGRAGAPTTTPADDRCGPTGRRPPPAPSLRGTKLRPEL